MSLILLSIRGQPQDILLKEVLGRLERSIDFERSIDLELVTKKRKNKNLTIELVIRSATFCFSTSS